MHTQCDTQGPHLRAGDTSALQGPNSIQVFQNSWDGRGSGSSPRPNHLGALDEALVPGSPLSVSANKCSSTEATLEEL